MSDGLGIDLSAAASQLGDALNGSSDSTPTTTPVADTSSAQVPSFTPTIPDSAAPQQNSGGHPAWQEILTRVPESLHPSIRPTLEQWDRGVQERLQAVHAQYAPYQQFTQMPVDQLSAAVQLFNILNTQPELLYQELHGQFGQQVAQGQNADEEFDPYAPQQVEDPRVSQIAQQQQMLMQQMQAAQDAQAQREADAWIDTRINEITSTFKARGIDPDMQYILGMAATIAGQNQGISHDVALNQAVQHYENALAKFSTARTAVANAPQVIPPNGAVPSSNFDATKLSDDQRRKLGADLLAQAMRES